MFKILDDSVSLFSSGKLKKIDLWEKSPLLAVEDLKWFIFILKRRPKHGPNYC